MPERNSNIEAWAAFANKLDKKEFFVIIVPDTEKAFHRLPKPLQGFASFETACWNIAIRAALYELAYLNLSVNTGPMSLCWLNARCRSITFKISAKSPTPFPGTIENMRKNGFQPNKPPVFANKFQRWIWEDDDEEVISREFNSMLELLNKDAQKNQQPLATAIA